MAEVQTLNNYVGTDDTGNGTTIVAEDMTTACQVYAAQMDSDPVTMQCTKKGIRCVLPITYTSFVAEVFDASGVARTKCSVTPAAYTVPAGTKQIFTATEAEGWEFVKWTIDGNDVEGEEGTKKVALLTIPASETSVTIRGVFKTTV